MRWAWLVVLALAACHRGGDGRARHDAAIAQPRDAAETDIDAAPPARAKPRPTKVVTGAHASCAVLSDATVRCWGANSAGQLGIGSTRDSSEPVAPKLRGVKDLVLGDDTACALLDDTSVTCWGRIGMGKAGPSLEPLAAPGVKYATRVFAVGGVGCATIGQGGGPKGTPPGALVCWGDVDARGRFSAADEHRMSTSVFGVDRVLQLTAHGALVEGGDVAYWTDGESPVRAGIANAVEVASTEHALCARLADGGVACFGAHPPCAAPKPPPPPPPARPKPKGKAKGKPKPSPPPPSAKPELARLPFEGATQLAFDAGGTCVVTAGRLQCLDPTDGCKLAPPWLAKVASTSGPCALLADGKVSCWRHEGDARDGSTIAGVTATQLSATADRACALTRDGVVCWDPASRPAPVSLP